jgi:PqqD family protein of HPr-rel-A system
MADNASTQWQAIRPELWIWADWEADYGIYDGGTGETHLLSELPAEVLRQLSRHVMTEAALTAKLARLCEVEETDDWMRKIAGLLAELADIELIEPIGP